MVHSGTLLLTKFPCSYSGTMNVAGFLAISLLLFFGAAESKGSLSEIQHTLSKRQADGNCTEEEVGMLYSTLDTMCYDNFDVLNDLVGQLLNSSSASRQQPDLNAIDELNRAAEGLCTDRCGGVLYRVSTECDPDDELVDLITNLCGFNGEILCRNALNSQAHSTSTACSNQWLSSLDPKMCPPGCKEALNTTIDEIGCCTNNNLDLYFYVFNAAIEDLYSTCEVQDPGFCPVTFQDQDRDRDGGAIGVAAATMGLLLVAIISAALSTI